MDLFFKTIFRAQTFSCKQQTHVIKQMRKFFFLTNALFLTAADFLFNLGENRNDP